MKILCYIDSMRSGGAQRVLSILMNAWASRGDHVTLVTHRNEQSFYQLERGIVLRNLGERDGNAWQALGKHLRRIPRLRRIVREEGPEVLVSFLDKGNVRALMAARGCGVRVVVSERINPVPEYELGTLWKWLRRRLYPGAAALVVQNGEQADYFRGLCPEMTVIPNPVDLEKYDNHEIDRSMTIVAAGRLRRQKGFDVLIRAFALVSGEFPEWRLHIYGEGGEKQALGVLCKSEGILDQVLLHGVTYDLPVVLAGCGCFVLSSRFEGTPNVLLEAMASGCPVIATKCSVSVTNILSDKKNGLLVPPEDVRALAAALRTMMRDKSARVAMGQAVRKAVEPFGVANIVPQWDSVFNIVRQARGAS